MTQHKPARHLQEDVDQPPDEPGNRLTDPSHEDNDQYAVDPDFWDSLLDSIPPWGDEIAAIMLIVFGVVSFLSLLNISSDATLSRAWSKVSRADTEHRRGSTPPGIEFEAGWLKASAVNL